MNKEEISGKAEEVKGKVEEGLGKLTGNENLRAKGAGEELKAKTKQAAGNVQQGANEAIDKTKERANELTD